MQQSADSRTYRITLEHESEKHELNLLNTRFGSYLKKIKYLIKQNHEYQQQISHHYSPSSSSSHDHQIEQLNQVRQQLNDELRTQTSIHIRYQRAQYDIQFFRNNLKSLSTYEQQIQTNKQQLQININELEQLKQQYQIRTEDLQNQKLQYNQSMIKLTEYSKEFDRIVYERIENENQLHTLKEQYLFEQEYYRRRQQEYEYFEQFHCQLTRNDFQNIIQKIRHDYQEFNSFNLIELEKFYQTKLDKIKQTFIEQEEKSSKTNNSKDIQQILNSTRQQQRTLIEQNLLLKDKLNQLEQDLRHTIEHNHQQIEQVNHEYKQLQIEIPELDYIIVHLRENTVNLWSEINTYRYLLVHLLDKQQPIIKQKTTTVATRAQTQYRDEATGFVVHIEDGLIWVRI